MHVIRQVKIQRKQSKICKERNINLYKAGCQRLGILKFISSVCVRMHTRIFQAVFKQSFSWLSSMEYAVVE